MQCGFAIKKLQLGEEPKPPLRLATRAMEKSTRWECSSEIFEWTQAEIPENVTVSVNTSNNKLIMH